jgi:hypothetical protein
MHENLKMLSLPVTQWHVFLEAHGRSMLHAIALESSSTGFVSQGNILRLKHKAACNSTLCYIYVSTFPLTLALLLAAYHCMAIPLTRASAIFLLHVHESTSTCMIWRTGRQLSTELRKQVGGERNRVLPFRIE